MTSHFRKIFYAISFETCGIMVTGLVLLVMTSADAKAAFPLSATAAIIGMLWSYAYNTSFEAWEAHQAKRGRSRIRRLAHSFLFEMTLLIQLLPLTMWWLSVGFWTAIGIEIGVSVAFIFYTYAFTWAFDRIFGLPASAS